MHILRSLGNRQTGFFFFKSFTFVCTSVRIYVAIYGLKYVYTVVKMSTLHLPTFIYIHPYPQSTKHKAQQIAFKARWHRTVVRITKELCAIVIDTQNVKILLALRAQGSYHIQLVKLYLFTI